MDLNEIKVRDIFQEVKEVYYDQTNNALTFRFVTQEPELSINALKYLEKRCINSSENKIIIEKDKTDSRYIIEINSTNITHPVVLTEVNISRILFKEIEGLDRASCKLKVKSQLLMGSKIQLEVEENFITSALFKLYVNIDNEGIFLAEGESL